MSKRLNVYSSYHSFFFLCTCENSVETEKESVFDKLESV